MLSGIFVVRVARPATARLHSAPSYKPFGLSDATVYPTATPCGARNVACSLCHSERSRGISFPLPLQHANRTRCLDFARHDRRCPRRGKHHGLQPPRGHRAIPCNPQSAIYNPQSIRGHSSVGRAPALQAGCQGFESPCLHASRRPAKQRAKTFIAVDQKGTKAATAVAMAMSLETPDQKPGAIGSENRSGISLCDSARAEQCLPFCRACHRSAVIGTTRCWHRAPFSLANGPAFCANSA